MRSSCLAVFALASALSAQTPTPLRFGFTSPIRPAAAPDTGLWACGDNYKVHFTADAVEFVPCLGASAPRNLPLHWQTLTLGREVGAALPLGSATLRHDDWRLTREHAGWREVYDVLPHGLEQSFVIDQPPFGSGDLVVRGRIVTPLQVPQIDAAHQALSLCDQAGHAVISYGAATAIDARGARLSLTTSVSGNEVTLRVPAAWLAGAAFPITVDPLIAPVTLNSTTTLGQVASTDIVCNNTTLSRNMMFVCTRAYSASDHDIYGWLCDSTFANAVQVLRDTSTTADDRTVSVAFVDGGPRWVVAYERGYLLNGTPSSTIRVYFHDLADTTLNGGSSAQVAQTTAAFLRNPDVGGALSGSQTTSAMVVFTSDPTSANGNTTSLRRMLANAAAATLSTPVTLGTGSQDRESPAINQAAQNGEGWLVVWQELNGSVWEIAGAYLNVSGVQWETTIVTSGARHFTQPQAAGGGAGQYTVTFVGSQDLTNTGGAELMARYVRRTSPILTLPARSIATAVPPLTSIGNGGLSYNISLGGTSLATYTIRRVVLPTITTTAYAARLGSTGGLVERMTLAAATGTSFTAPSNTFVRGGPGTHPIVYGSNETNLPLYGSRFEYPAATSTAYGTGCGTGSLQSGPPVSGLGSFAVTGSGFPANAPAALTFAAAPASIPLNGIGMTACFANYDPAAFLVNLPVSTTSGGLVSLSLPLPDAPAIFGDLFLQVTYANAGVNPAGLQATRGLQLAIR